jgi:membrane protease subunit HflK
MNELASKLVEKLIHPRQVAQPRQWKLETTIVTGDLNTAWAEWVILFRIEHAFDFLFNVRDPSDALRDISESVMREVVGDRTVDEVLTFGRQNIKTRTQVTMQEVVNLYGMGLCIDQVPLKTLILQNRYKFLLIKERGQARAGTNDQCNSRAI